jgi:hypothetical protein
VRERVLVQNSWYSLTSVDAPVEGVPLGPGVLYAGGDARPIELRALEGIPAERAVAAADDPREVWVADGWCYERTPGEVLACLRSERRGSERRRRAGLEHADLDLRELRRHARDEVLRGRVDVRGRAA